MTQRQVFGLFVLSAALWAAACTTPAANPVPTTAAGEQQLSAAPTSAQISAADTPTANTALPTESSATEAATAQPSPTATVEPTMQVCSPLEGITLPELNSPDLLKNPFQPPRPGMDDGHHGVDFAYWSRGERKTMLGLPVYTVLGGKVAGVLDNRYPYGYAVIVETDLEQLPSAWETQAAVPTQAATVIPNATLYCPEDPQANWNQSGRSLYLLYAHLNEAPQVMVGQSVTCGQEIGQVGTSGKSVNYHLHLEARAGPAGVVFPPMAHYDNRATVSEMNSYCTWRVSGLFQMFDPMQILSLQP